MSKNDPAMIDNDIHPDDGARLSEIVRYIMKHTNYNEARAKKAVIEVLVTGLASEKIIKTSRGKYVLVNPAKPEGIHYKIRQPKFSDSSSSSISSDEAM